LRIIFSRSLIGGQAEAKEQHGRPHGNTPTLWELKKKITPVGYEEQCGKLSHLEAGEEGTISPITGWASTYHQKMR
jgi:hypothetical protein